MLSRKPGDYYGNGHTADLIGNCIYLWGGKSEERTQSVEEEEW